jgi:hypothetical protein
MTTFTSEDRQKAYEPKIGRIRRANAQGSEPHTLNEEIMTLKTKLAQAERRADSWQEAYHNAMDTMSKMSRARP